MLHIFMRNVGSSSVICMQVLAQRIAGQSRLQLLNLLVWEASLRVDEMTIPWPIMTKLQVSNMKQEMF